MILLGPLLLAIPFVFRETCAFWILPMLALLWQRLTPQREAPAASFEISNPKSQIPPVRRLLACAFLAIASIVVLGLIYRSPIAAGRPSLAKADIFFSDEKDLRSIYRDATATDRFHPTAAQWPGIFARRFAHKIGELVHDQIHGWQRTANAMMTPLLLTMPLGLLYWLRRRDPVAIGVSALVAAILVLLCLFYRVTGHTGLRIVMAATPLATILYSRLWFDLIYPRIERIPSAYRLWPHALVITVVAGLVAQHAAEGFRDMTIFDRVDDNASRLIGRLDHPDRTMLVGPHRLCIPYLANNLGISFAFSPVNRTTLDLLCSRYNVATFIFELNEEGVTLTPQDIIDMGLKPYCKIKTADANMLVFRRPQYAGEEAEWDPQRVEELEPVILGQATTRPSGKSRK
jgi:hypothetical protein